MTVWSSCPTCYFVIWPKEVVVRICDTDNAHSFYFECPKCGQAQIRLTDTAFAAKMLENGASVDHWVRTASPKELSEERPNRSLTQKSIEYEMLRMGYCNGEYSDDRERDKLFMFEFERVCNFYNDR